METRERQLDHSWEPVPDLVESDVDSDDKDSVSGSPDLESGGDGVI